MQAIASGFGLNFYGFFAFAALWVVAYFVWATRTNAAERNREQASQSCRENSGGPQTDWHPSQD